MEATCMACLTPLLYFDYLLFLFCFPYIELGTKSYQHVICLPSEGRHLVVVVANSYCQNKKRVNFTQCYIWSKGLFQCGAWSPLNFSSYKKVHSAIMYAYRAIGGYMNNTCYDDDHIIDPLMSCVHVPS